VKKYFDNYQDPHGDAIEGAFVTVSNPNGSLATLYGANSTANQISNPVRTDALGFYSFYVMDGRYTLSFHKDGYVDLTIPDVEIVDDTAEEALIDAKITAALLRLNLSAGAPGAPGAGLPKGGSAGQIPKKLSNNDYDIAWGDQSVATGFRPEVDLPIGADGHALMNNANSNNFLLLMTRNVTIDTPTGYQAGDRIRLIFQQDSQGGRTLTFGPGFQYSGNTTPAFSVQPGAIYRLDLDLIKGGVWVITPFIIQYNGDSTNIPAPTNNGGGFAFKLVTVYPWDGGVAPVAAVLLDSATLAQVRAAVAGAGLGSKRAAYISALKTAFGTSQVLTLKRDGVSIVAINYTGQLTNVISGQDLGVGLSTEQDASTMVAADIDTGVWTAVLTSADRSCTIEAGPSGSGKMLILNNDTAVGKGIVPALSLLTQRSIDGLL